jgi:hypothetical protein
MDAITPYLTLIGTVTAVLFGYYQWRKQHGNPNRVAVADARRKASEALWSKLEEVNLRLRSESPATVATLPTLLQEVNSLFIANSLYLEDGQQSAIHEYVQEMYKMSEVVGSHDEDVRSNWRSTAAMPPDPKSPELREAFARLSRLRSIVKSQLLRLAGG